MTNFGSKVCFWSAIALALLVAGACQSGPTAADYLENAKQALSDNQIASARTYADQAASEGLDHRSLRLIRADIERRIAERAASDDKFQKAYRHFREAAEIDPRRLGRERAYLRAAQIAEKLGRAPREIARTAQKAVEANPASAKARRLAGQMWDEAGRPEKAISSYLWLWQADRSRLAIGRRLATLYRQIDQPDDAGVILQQLRRADPDNPRVTLKLANYYADTDRPGRARRLFEKVVEAHPNRPGLLLDYARFLKRQGEAQRARKFEHKAYDEMPGVDRRKMRELQ